MITYPLLSENIMLSFFRKDGIQIQLSKEAKSIRLPHKNRIVFSMLQTDDYSV